MPTAQLQGLVHAGVDAIQIRDKGADDRMLYEFAAAAVLAVRPLGAKVIVNDRVDIARAADADGVHLGVTDLPVAVARALGPDLLIGVTCRCRASVRIAAMKGADYAGIGPVFATRSKPGLPEPMGLAGLREATGLLPAIAIAGIDATRVAGVLAAGAQGVAVLGAVTDAADPPGAAKEIAAALGRR